MQNLLTTPLSSLKTKEIKEFFSKPLISCFKGNKNPVFLHQHRVNSLIMNLLSYFHEKISKMRCSLSHDSESITNPLPDLSCCQSELTDFCTVNTNDIRKYLVSSGVKTCALDPLPFILLRKCLDALLPVITRIVNLSLTTGNVLRHFKEAMVRPKLKKDSLDHKMFFNSRHISNLKLLSKITEKAVACQLTVYLNANGLQEVFQSAYKVAHSTETALLKVQSDTLNAIEKQESVLLLLLDLSAAFDTVDHVILLSRLNTRYGFKGNTLHWFASCLKERRQFIQVENTRSSSVELQWGVPQGSVLGAILYTLYTAPLGDIIRRHGPQFHLLMIAKFMCHLSHEPSQEHQVQNICKVAFFHSRNFSSIRKCLT